MPQFFQDFDVFSKKKRLSLHKELIFQRDFDGTLDGLPETHRPRGHYPPMPSPLGGPGTNYHNCF